MRIIKEVGQSLCLINCIQISIFLCLTWNMTVYCDASTSIYEIPVRNYSPSKQFDWFRRHFYACTYGANWIILSHSWTLLVALLLTYIFFSIFCLGLDNVCLAVSLEVLIKNIIVNILFCVVLAYSTISYLIIHLTVSMTFNTILLWWFISVSFYL